MKQRSLFSRAFCAAMATAVLLWLHSTIAAQLPLGKQQTPASQNPAIQTDAANSFPQTNPVAEVELQTGIALSRKGQFREAIPHFLAAQGQVAKEYVADFNLALCYVGTRQFSLAIPILHTLSNSGQGTADVENLLAQAYLGNAQPHEAFEEFQKAALLTPNNEKLYLFIADACMEHRDYALGLQVVDLGLKHLPQSARLRYQRGMFLSSLDHLDLARPDFDLAAKLAPESDIAFDAAAQKNMLNGNIPETIRVARDGIQKGHANTILLSVFGEALLRSGVSPDQPEFAEARTVLEKSVADRPDYSGSQIALSKLYLMEGRINDAITHLETSRQLDTSNPSVYAQLAKAYRLHGDRQQADAMLAILARLNQEQAETIRAAPGDTKTGYSGPALELKAQAPQ